MSQSEKKTSAPKTDIPNSNASKTEGFTPKRIAALIGAILLVSLYVITLFVAIFDKSQGGKWFMICLGATFAIPFLLWIYIGIYGQITGKKTIADLNYNIGPNSLNDLEAEKETPVNKEDQ